MRYNTTTDPEGKHPLDAQEYKVEYAGDPGWEPPETEPVGYTGTDYTYNAVLDPLEVEGGHDVDPASLHPMEVPRHGLTASENSGVVADRVVPYGPTNANPTYPQDAGDGFETAVVDDEGEPVVTEDQGEAENGEGITSVASLSTGSEMPAGNASTEEWQAYAVTQGMDPAVAEGMTRDELREEYGWQPAEGTTEEG